MKSFKDNPESIDGMVALEMNNQLGFFLFFCLFSCVFFWFTNLQQSKQTRVPPKTDEV